MIGRSAEIALLKSVVSILERAHPAARRDWLSTSYERVQKFAKYVGVPALLIASVLPVYNIAGSALDYRNSQYIKNVYIAYANGLSQQHQFDRSLKVLAQLDKIASLDPQAQYASAKISAEAAFYQGKAYDEAEDSVSILLALHDNRPWFFPEFGGDKEILALQLRLIDIDLKRSRYVEARGLITKFRQARTGLDIATQARLAVQEAKSHLYTYDRKAAAPLLRQGLELSRRCGCTNVEAEAEHGLGTFAMFTGSSQQAETHLTRSLALFEKVGDLDGQQRAYTNLALVRGNELDWQGSLAARRQQERLARQAGDELGVGNALVGLAVAERNLGNPNRALSLAVEAEGIFRRLGHSGGLAAALVNQANIYLALGDNAKTLDAANRALTYFIGERDVRGAVATLGIIAATAEELGDNETALYGLGGSVGLARYLAADNLGTNRDLFIHLAAIERMRDANPSRFALLREAVEPRLRELERAMSMPQLQTGLAD